GTISVDRSSLGGARFLMTFPALQNEPSSSQEDSDMMPSMKVVILGGSAAGPKVASKVFRLMPNADITILDRGQVLSYAGCGLPYYISGLVDDIEEIGEEIELIAVNARVKSAHTGVEGAPLGVIAEAIWHLSIDATSQKTTISELLREVVTATEGLQAAVREGTGDGGSDSGSIIGELSGLLNELKGMNDGVVGLVKEIEGGSRSLSGLIEETIESISVHKDLRREVSGLSALFDEVIAAARRAVSHEELEKARGLSLEYIASNYTMQRERIIHQSVASNVIPFTGRDRGDVTPPAPEEGGACDDDLGDNVELF
ncbi:MAG TPA: hypothetical protein PKJ17_04920, partial [Syntrophorhabdaceae bacterium]|nr:hypothetical protein [Syntrophorhabdaceae bacterium]